MDGFDGLIIFMVGLAFFAWALKALAGSQQRRARHDGEPRKRRGWRFFGYRWEIMVLKVRTADYYELKAQAARRGCSVSEVVSEKIAGRGDREQQQNHQRHGGEFGHVSRNG